MIVPTPALFPIEPTELYDVDDARYPDEFLVGVAANEVNSTHPWHDADDWQQAVKGAVECVLNCVDLEQSLARLFTRFYMEFNRQHDVPIEWQNWAYASDDDALVPQARPLSDGGWSE